MTGTGHRTGGQPSKGERKFVGFRLPAEQAKILAEISEATNTTVTDLVANWVIERMGHEDLAELRTQPELPLQKIG